jgi:hypothetical protein
MLPALLCGKISYNRGKIPSKNPLSGHYGVLHASKFTYPGHISTRRIS